MADTRYTETVDASRWADALLGGAAAFAILLAIVMFAGGETLAAVIAGLVGIAMFAAFRTFTTLRIELDDDEVRASFGNFQHSIPLSDIRQVTVQRYAWLPHGGWGIRFSFSGRRAYSVPFLRTGVQFSVGSSERWYLSSARPQELAAAVLSALGEREATR